METARRPDHFSRVADGYATYRPAYPAALVDLLADVTPAHDLAWDAGCGSGQLSVGLAHRFTRVIATDLSAEQLARGAPHARVEYRRAGAGASGIPPGTVDLAVAAQAAHWFDLPAYYAEVRRVSRPGAIVALVSYGLIRIAPEVDPVIDAFYETLGSHWPPERRHVETGYRSLPFPFAEQLTPPMDMREIWTLPHVLGYVETWSALRGAASDSGGDRVPFEHFRRELERVWGVTTARRTVRWDLALRVGRVDSTG